LKKPITKIGLVEWLKVKTLSSSPSTTKTIIKCVYFTRLCIISIAQADLCGEVGKKYELCNYHPDHIHLRSE
jgi:hypothetical protein